MAQQPRQTVNLPVVDDFDPANQALSDALRRSFAILKWIMLAAVVMYLFSGLFRVRPGEIGYVLRMGRILPQEFSEGWHFSWPFPIDENRTMSIAGERTVEASFVFQLTDTMKTEGISPGGSPYLRPGRDNYLLTGDLNILHARLIAQYRIKDAIDYLSNVIDRRRSREELPETAMLVDLLTASAIEVSARRNVDAVYKDRSGFLDEVAARLQQRLDELRQSGSPTGLAVQRVIATSFEGYEAILPMLNVMPDFEEAQANEQKKGQTIAEARGLAVKIYTDTAGADWEALRDAVDAEFAALIARSSDLPALREKTEALLRSAGGNVQRIVSSARSQQDQIVKSAAGDAERVRELADAFRQNPTIALQQFRLRQLQEIMSLPTISKRWVPPEGRIWVNVQRDATLQEKAARERAIFEEREIKPQKRAREIELGPMQLGPKPVAGQ